LGCDRQVLVQDPAGDAEILGAVAQGDEVVHATPDLRVGLPPGLEI
jgi:hypothetical protein